MGDNRERRQHARVLATLDVLALEEGSVEPDRVQLLNLSRSGAFLAMSRPPRPGTQLRLLLHRPGDTERVAVGVVVVRQLAGGAGVRFTALEERARAAVERLVAAFPAAPGRCQPPPLLARAPHPLAEPDRPEVSSDETTLTWLSQRLKRALGR